ncbi:MAG: RecQ family ATP-dependent DNA helicase [Pedobacter sp.]|nr:MAG: RecQ family ATP-dependent DNA helicase [Pedobacter sp.]
MTANSILKHYWGYDQFRPLQAEIIQTILSGQDCLALLPTGGGKSICFQIPGILQEGICIVVSPLIALMKDQVENLKSKGISAIAIYAGMGKRELDILLDNCIYGNIKFLYLSPERLLSRLVQERIAYMKVNLIAIDEAHCISQWGYDFRPAYLEVVKLRELHPQIPVLAVTATATKHVQADIIDKLNFTNANIFKKSFERLNISYVVSNVEDKAKKVIQILNNVKGSSIIYVRNRKSCSEFAEYLNQVGISASYYHAGLTSEERTLRQDSWKKNQIQVIVATNAFGMGIDKADVRTVIHLDLPDSLEAYYQEAGRAGRDEKRAYAVLLANETDRINLTNRVNQQFVSTTEIKQIYHHIGSYFQISYGAGEGLSFPFDMVEFSKRYQIHPLKVYHVLKYLEKDALISFTESIFEPSKLHFLANHEDLYRFQIENKVFDKLIKAILRSYGGVFEGFIKISESEIANRSGQSTIEVKKKLLQLQDLGLVYYQPQSDKAQIVFPRARLDALHLDIDSKYVKSRQEILQMQLNAVLKYASTATCRSYQIRTYFGEENPNKCGVCDVCLEDNKREYPNLKHERIAFEIIQIIQVQAMGMEDILQKLPNDNSTEVIVILRELLDAGKIKSDGKKFYL